MRGLLRSSFFWRFLGGFALGAVSLAAMHPATAAAPGMTHISR